jgi:hypothetical protein
MGEAAAADEGRHEPGTEALWNESWYFDFMDAAGTFGGYVRVGMYPNLGDAGLIWFWACVVGEDRPLVTVIDHTVPIPKAGIELRHDGLWADHVIEEPLQRWSLGLEAFGAALDDPAETYRGCRGDRTPLGWDLEWITDVETYQWPEGQSRYEVPCRVVGEVLVGDEKVELDGWGQRDHSWGVRDWWTLGWCWTAGRLEDGTRFHAAAPRIEGIDWAAGYVGGPAGPLEDVNRMVATEQLGDEGIPTSAHLDLPPLDLQVDPVAWSPVLLESPEGKQARFPRALSRFTEADGRTGVGWIEFNQPPPPET